MNKAIGSVGERPNLDLWRWAQPVPKIVQAKTEEAMTRRPLRSLRKAQASGMPFLPLSR